MRYHKIIGAIFLMVNVFINNQAEAKPAVVKIVETDSGYELSVDGEPYVIRGAGVNWPDGKDLEALKRAGGNTFRTWSTDYAEQELEKARQLGLKVVMGIDLKKQLHGFDYNDDKAVAAQLAWVKKQVVKFKDHPNLLAWMVANEPNLLFDENGALAKVNPKVYQAIADIVDFIHQVDGRHPVSFSFAGVSSEHVEDAMKHVSQVDFLSFQVYGDLINLPQLVAALPNDKPYMVTEFGPLGHWERPTTSWGREIEEPSSVKASSLFTRMEKGLNDSRGLNIGHFVFEWGQKQERTPTWYGMFDSKGNQSARIDEVTRYWTGAYPLNRAPSVWSISLNGQAPETSLILEPVSRAIANVSFSEPNQDNISVEWQLRKEVGERSMGGAFEAEPEQLPLLEQQQTVAADSAQVSFKVPREPGEYRLFFYVYDGKGKVGYANFPFLVK